MIIGINSYIISNYYNIIFKHHRGLLHAVGIAGSGMLHGVRVAFLSFWKRHRGRWHTMASGL